MHLFFVNRFYICVYIDLFLDKRHTDSTKLSGSRGFVRSGYSHDGSRIPCHSKQLCHASLCRLPPDSPLNSPYDWLCKYCNTRTSFLQDNLICFELRYLDTSGAEPSRAQDSIRPLPSIIK